MSRLTIAISCHFICPDGTLYIVNKARLIALLDWFPHDFHTFKKKNYLQESVKDFQTLKYNFYAQRYLKRGEIRNEIIKKRVIIKVGSAQKQ